MSMDDTSPNAPSEPPAKRRRLSSGSDIQIKTSLDQSVRPIAPATVTVSDHLLNREEEVGIAAYVTSDITPFSGFLKTRYSDFIVNEILPNGEVVHLRNTKGPKKQQGETVDKTVTERVKDSVDGYSNPLPHANGTSEPKVDESTRELDEEHATISDDQRAQLVDYLNETAAEELINLFTAIRSQPRNKSNPHPSVRTEFTADRSIRGKIHQFIRSTFNSTIESSTDKDGTLVLSASRASNNKSNGWRRGPSTQTQHKRPNKQSWQERGGDYVHFTLYKENKDTMEAISWLTKQLHCNPKCFQFAGTKDKRAITTQRCSAYRIEPERLATQNHSLRGSKIGDFSCHPHGLELGDLGGNEFHITLRDCQFFGQTLSHLNLESIKADISSRLSSLHTNGYMNYYGEQRFGTFNIRTDTIGLHILQGNYGAACDAILAYPPASLAAAQNPDEQTRIGQDDRNRALAIHQWRQNNRLNEALDILPRKFSAEAQLMRHLSRNANDFLGALMTIQRNLRLMYVHAYQSLVWNKAATKRMQLYGTQVVEGDLVMVNEHKDKEQNAPVRTTTTTTSSTHHHAATAVDGDGEIIIEPAAHDRATDINDVFERARPLTAAEAESGAYTIFDVVLPQPGFDIVYPSNAIEVFYRDFMKSGGGISSSSSSSSGDGGGVSSGARGLDPYDMRRKHRDFSLSGAYRKIVGRIEQDGWGCDVRVYERDEEQFVRTDLEELRGEGGVLGDHRRGGADDDDRGGGSVMNGAGAGAEVKKEGEDGEGTGSKIAVVLKFRLGASQYATMVLRELSRGGIVQYKPDFSGGR